MKYLIFILVLSVSAEARYRAAPLMPPETGFENSQLKTVKSNPDKKKEMIAAIGLGLFGSGGLSSHEPLGLQWLWGGKVDFRIPVLVEGLRARTSLGYFRKSESEGSVSITQNVLDLGLGADWLIFRSKSVDFSLGLSNHVDMVFSRVSLYDASGTSPLSFRYRVAPLTSAQIHLTQTLLLAADFEFGLIPQDTVRTYGAWSLGVAFPF